MHRRTHARMLRAVASAAAGALIVSVAALASGAVPSRRTASFGISPSSQRAA